MFIKPLFVAGIVARFQLLYLLQNKRALILAVFLLLLLLRNVPQDAK